ncbi:MAG: SpoIID/LytB domain-containing protein [Lachnospirales bacterium]
MKNKFGVIIALILIFSFTKEIYATDTEYYIRVGLESSYFSIDELDINLSDIKAGYELNGSLTGASQPTTRGANFTNLVAPKLSADSSSYVQLAITFNTFEDANNYKNELVAQAFPAVVAISGAESYTVVLGPYTDDNAANVEMDNYTSFYNQSAMVINHSNIFKLSDDGKPIMIYISNDLKPQVCDINNNPFYISYSYVNSKYQTVSDKDIYRGIMEVQKNKDNTLKVINVVLLEEYLYSVVPSEMPSSWEFEALKAQAVAARNYVYTQVTHDDYGYDVCDTTHCQVYTGYANESDITTKAVNETRGIMAYYDNEPINAVFYSSSGGASANSEDVWVNVVPYLRAVDDSYDTTGKTWTRQFTQSQLTTAAKVFGKDIGTVTSVVVTKKDSYGRAIDLTFTGEKGSFVVSKDNIRAFFANYDYSLDSTMFTITNSFGETYTSSSTSVIDVINKTSGVVEVVFSDIYIVNDTSTSQIDTSSLVVLGANNIQNIITKNEYVTSSSNGATNILELSGKGWGHGVGLSQHGANGMAKAGYTYDQILKHYYSGISLY